MNRNRTRVIPQASHSAQPRRWPTTYQDVALLLRQVKSSEIHPVDACVLLLSSMYLPSRMQLYSSRQDFHCLPSKAPAT